MIMQPAQGEQIARGTKSGDLAERNSGDMRMVAERFPLMDVRQMHLDRRQSHSGQGVADRNTRMGIGGGVDDDAPISGFAVLDPADEFAFAVRLPNVHLDAKVFRQPAQGRVNAIE